MSGSWLRGIVPGEPQRGKRVEGSVPKSMRGVPNEMIVGDRIREAIVRGSPILEGIVHNLVVEQSVREIHPTREGLMRNTNRSGVSQSPFAAIYDLRPVCEANLPDEEPFFSTSTVVFDPKWVDETLGLEEEGRIRAGGERDRVAAGVVAIHGGGGWWTGGFE